MPSDFTAPTIAAIFGMSRSFGERHAAPMQKRVAPAALACFALASTASTAHELFGFDAGRVARGLRAVRAVLGTAAGLDRQQRRHLHRVRVVMRAMHRVGAREQVGERQVHQRRDFGAGPVVAEGGGRHAKLPAGETSGNGKARVSI